MTDESLGHIDIRFDAAGGHPTAAVVAKPDVVGSVSDMVRAMRTSANTLMASYGPGGLGVAVTGAINAMKGVGGTGGAAAIGGAAASAGVLAGAILATSAAIYAVKSVTESILDRVDTLSRVSPTLAWQGALDRLSQIRRDINEARALSPIYSEVSLAVRTLRDSIAPLLMLIRYSLATAVVPIINAMSGVMTMIVDAIRGVYKVIQSIVSAMQTVFVGLFRKAAEMAKTANAFIAPILVFFSGIAAAFAVAFRTIGSGLEDIIRLLTPPVSATGNKWANDLLDDIRPQTIRDKKGKEYPAPFRIPLGGRST